MGFSFEHLVNLKDGPKKWAAIEKAVLREYCRGRVIKAAREVAALNFGVTSDVARSVAVEKLRDALRQYDNYA